MKTLYLHIGTPKTGTTSIQNFCVENAALLEEQGYCYPLFSHKFDKTSIMRNGYFLSVRYYKDTGEEDLIEEEKKFRQGMDMVIDTFRKFDHVILSDESLWNVVFKRGKTDLWKKLQREAEQNQFVIKVIVYLRRQDKLAESWWNQKIKVGERLYSTTPWEEFVKDSSLLEMNYYEPLQIIEKKIGQENIIVRRFDKQYFKNGSVYEDFLDAIGIRYSSRFVITEEVRNTALLGNAPEMKRIINTISGLTHRDNVFFRRILMKLSEEKPELKKKTLFSPKEAERYMDSYREDNRKLMNKYFGKDEDLFEMDFSDYDKWVSTSKEMEEDMLRFVGQVAIRLREENQELKKQIHKLEAELLEQKQEMKTIKERLNQPLRNIASAIRHKRL